MDDSGAAEAGVSGRSGLAREISPTLKLALPVVLGEIGWMAMGVEDTILVSHLGPEAIGAVGIGSSVYFTFAVFGMGLFLGLDTLVSQAFGAGDQEKSRRWLRTGLLMACILTPILTIFFAVILQSVNSWGLSAEVLPLARPYMVAILWSTGPLLVYAAFRRYLQSIGQVRPVMVALLSANLLNIAGNWALINGHLGLPALGVTGSAWATVISRIFLAVALGWILWRIDPPLFQSPFFSAVKKQEIGTLLKLGLPAAVQITLEVGIFSLAGAIVGRMAPVALASHQIVLNITSLTFMIPFGIASAAAVRVGHAVGAGRMQSAARAGWAAIFLTIGAMICLAITFLSIPATLVDFFTSDAEIIRRGVGLLAIAAVFQLFDGLQAVTTGALRGLGDTHTPAICNLVAHWLIGLPVGIYLAFNRHMEVRGVWVGLSTGLIVTGAVLLMVWRKKSQMHLK